MDLSPRPLTIPPHVCSIVSFMYKRKISLKFKKNILRPSVPTWSLSIDIAVHSGCPVVSAYSHTFAGVGLNSTDHRLEFCVIFSLVFLRKMVLRAQPKAAGTYTRVPGSGAVVCTVYSWIAGADSNRRPILFAFFVICRADKIDFPCTNKTRSSNKFGEQLGKITEKARIGRTNLRNSEAQQIAEVGQIQQPIAGGGGFDVG